MTAEPEQSIVERGYDAVYDAWPRAVTLHRIWRERVLGPGCPDGFEHISFATTDELRRLVEALRLDADDDLLDLGCGAGGSGLWVARETGARLTGVDISDAGLRLAGERAARRAMSDRATFRRGSFSDTGLPDRAMDAAMSLDALQYADDKLAAMREVARILRPGGRFAMCAFVLDPSRVAAMPGAWSDAVEDYGDPLRMAGLTVLACASTEGWRERVEAAYSAAIASREQISAEMGEVAAAALLFEMTLTLEHRPYRDRVFAVAEKDDD